MRRRPRYQIFVSSTFSDLSTERDQVTWKLLKDRHIPAGMETFPAADDRGWETISRAIDESDYYILIVGWRYGSLEPATGLSWTHREYRYAKEQGIPVLAFLRDEDDTPLSKAERDPEGQARMKLFRQEVSGDRLYKSWRHAQDLCNAVGEALWHRIHRDEDEGTERPGWFRGDTGLVSPEAVNELARLSRENNELRTQIAALAHVESAELSLSTPPAERVLTKHSWTPWPNQILLKTGPSNGLNTSAVLFKSWLDTLHFTIWLPLTVINSGRTAASEVLVELNIPHGREVRGRQVNRGDVSDVLLANLHEDASFKGNDVYVQRVATSDGILTIRQRIKRVLGKSSEPLVFFGVVLDDDKDWPEQFELEIAYTIRDLSGVVQDGSLKIPVTLLQGEPLGVASAHRFLEAQKKIT